MNTIPAHIAEIAAEVGISDPEGDESLQEYCLRLRSAIEAYGEELVARLDDMTLDLDEFEAELDEQPDSPQERSA